MPGVVFLDTCKFVGLPSRAQGRMIGALDVVARQMNRDVTVTCAEEGHRPDDPHTKKKAFDVRVKDLPPAILLTLYHNVMQQLGAAFTTLYECPSMPTDPLLQQIAYINPEATAPHIHVQVKRGTDYPTDGA